MKVNVEIIFKSGERKEFDIIGSCGFIREKINMLEFDLMSKNDHKFSFEPHEAKDYINIISIDQSTIACITFRQV